MAPSIVQPNVPRYVCFIAVLSLSLDYAFACSVNTSQSEKFALREDLSRFAIPSFGLGLFLGCYHAQHSHETEKRRSEDTLRNVENAQRFGGQQNRGLNPPPNLSRQRISHGKSRFAIAGRGVRR